MLNKDDATHIVEQVCRKHGFKGPLQMAIIGALANVKLGLRVRSSGIIINGMAQLSTALAPLLGSNVKALLAASDELLEETSKLAHDEVDTKLRALYPLGAKVQKLVEWSKDSGMAGSYAINGQVSAVHEKPHMLWVQWDGDPEPVEVRPTELYRPTTAGESNEERKHN
jgi:hypothetical protein